MLPFPPLVLSGGVSDERTNRVKILRIPFPGGHCNVTMETKTSPHGIPIFYAGLDTRSYFSISDKWQRVDDTGNVTDEKILSDHLTLTRHYCLLHVSPFMRNMSPIDALLWDLNKTFQRFESRFPEIVGRETLIAYRSFLAEAVSAAHSCGIRSMVVILDMEMVAESRCEEGEIPDRGYVRVMEKGESSGTK